MLYKWNDSDSPLREKQVKFRWFHLPVGSSAWMLAELSASILLEMIGRVRGNTGNI